MGITKVARGMFPGCRPDAYSKDTRYGMAELLANCRRGEFRVEVVCAHVTRTWSRVP